MARVLVLGGRGMLGWMVVRVLSATAGLAVTYTSRDCHSGLFYDIESDQDRLRRILEQTGHFAYIINCIGVLSSHIDAYKPQSVHRALMVNALFPYHLADLAQEFNLRVMHISTDGVFSGNAPESYLETAPCDCTDMYGKTKSLGEVCAPNFLTIRCSIIGPDPIGHKGLLEWFLARPDNGTVNGYTNHLWNGVTTLQLAELCRQVVLTGVFDAARKESFVHHFCPNNLVSKYELLKIFKKVFAKRITILPTPSSVASNRVLATQYQTFPALFGCHLNVEQAIQQLAKVELKDQILQGY